MPGLRHKRRDPGFLLATWQPALGEKQGMHRFTSENSGLFLFLP
jgi:hypothetical protein